MNYYKKHGQSGFQPTHPCYLFLSAEYTNTKYLELLGKYAEMIRSGEANLPSLGEDTVHEINIRNTPGGRPGIIFKALVAIPSDEEPYEDLWWK